LNKSLSFLLLAAAALGAERYRASEPHMGTLVTITLYAAADEQAQSAFSAAFARIAELNRIFSDYLPESELSRVCESQRPANPELLRVLRYAQELSDETGGAFDITIGPLTRLWRDARRSKSLPESAGVKDALARSGYQKLGISSRGIVSCLAPGMQLDAGGIAKGFAADEALAALRRNGVNRAIVAVSGDVVVGDPPPGQDGWKIQVQGRVLRLANSAVSTSGDEFQFIELNGSRYSHILDPRTGEPLRDPKPVSVIAKTGLEADSLATALSVLGPRGAAALAAKRGVRVIGQASQAPGLRRSAPRQRGQRSH
jgi:thiamine biosynthesis lipoprotein